jgi:hypothetical protein
MDLAEEVASVDFVVVKALALRADVPIGKGALLLVAALSKLLFLVRSVIA